MLTNQNNIRVQEITPEGVMAGSMPDVDKPEYQEARKEFFKDVAKGAVTAPLTGPADIIEMGAAVPPTASAATNAMQQGFEEAAKYVNREAVEQIIKDVTGIELKGTAGELLGEVVGIPGGPALVSGIGGLVSKYSDDVLRNLDNITDEARELFRTASGGDGTDGMATVTAGASRETVPTGIKPDLPDTSINPSMIGESTPLGAEAIDSYKRAKDLKPELTEEELFTQTGVYKGADGKFRFELSTVNAELDLGGLDDLKFNGEVELKDLLDFDSLFDAYNERYYSSEAFDYVTPEGLDKLKVKLVNNEDYSGLYVHSNSPFSTEGESIGLNLSQIDSEQELLSVLLHEVQHAIQAREGFTRGANIEMFYKEVAEKLGLGKNVSKRTHEKELKKLIDNVENTYVFEKFEQTRKRLNRDTGGQDLPEGHPLRDNPFSAFSQGESALINKVIPDILLERYKQEPYGRIFPTLKLEDYKITIEDVRKHLKGHSEFINFKIGYFDDMQPHDAVQQDFSAAMMEAFLDEADEFLSNPKMTPHDVRFIFGKELQDRRSIDVYNEVPRRALLEYKRKYGELEAKAVEERLARRKQLKNSTDMKISEIEEQMRKEFPPLDMHIRRSIAKADPEFAKGIDFDRELRGQGLTTITQVKGPDGGFTGDAGVIPPEKARLDDFKKGGAVPMRRQMELFEQVQGAFNEGGLMQEGGTVDPESGNEVPVGSMQEEVRDDIPAQLSEGEFVFPADVVRYIGLEKLMQMRQEAKRGLEMMDKMGQMGNADEATVPDDIPFDLSDLDMEDDGIEEFAQGGVVEAQQGTFIPPTGVNFTPGGQRQSQYTAPDFTIPVMPPMPPMQPPIQGPVQSPVPTLPKSPVPGIGDFLGSGQGGQGGGAAQLITIVNTQTGAERQINFIPGVTQIPEGFVRKEDYTPIEKPVTETPQAIPTAQQQQDDESSSPSVPSTKDATGVAYDRGKIKNKDLKTALTAAGMANLKDVGPAIAALFTGSATGLLTQMGRKAGQAMGYLAGNKQHAGAVLGGVLDEFRGEGEFSIGKTALDQLSDLQQQQIADTFKSVTEKMSDFYTKEVTGKDGEVEVKTKSQEEIMDSLRSEANRLEISTTFTDRRGNTRNKSQVSLEREISKAYAIEIGNERREERKQAAAQASVFGISATKADGTPKTTAELRAEQKAAEDAAKAEAAAQQRGARGAGLSYADESETSDPRGDVGSTVAGLGGYSATDYGGIFNKGGLAQQMKQSGLASKK